MPKLVQLPFAEIIAELVARAEEGPPPALGSFAHATVSRYRPPRYIRHPGQLTLPHRVADDGGMIFDVNGKSVRAEALQADKSSIS